MTIFTDVEAAMENVIKADDAFLSALQKTYPVGSLVLVKHGRSECTIKIDGYISHRSRQGYLLGINIKTEKQRMFYFKDIQAVYK